MNTTNKVFPEIIRQKGLKNMIFSPLSMDFFSAILLFSTTGASQKQLMEFLDIPESELDKYKERVLEIIKKIKETPPQVALKTANSIWINEQFTLKSDYTTSMKEDFEADLFIFSTDAPAIAQQQINQWVSEKTEKFIPKIDLEIDKLTLAVLINTLYFKANWYKKLEREKKWLESFYMLDETSKNILYLKTFDSGENILYLRESDFHAISIPYQNSNFCMEIYLPFDKYGLSAFINRLPALELENISSKFTFGNRIHVQMPSFDFEEEIQLNEIYQNLGVDRIFSFSQDFSPMLALAQGIGISDIKQKARIKVDETGTKAAAVTYGSSASLGLSKKEEPIYFQAEHPFLFLIRNRKDNIMLFMGTLTEPEDYVPPKKGLPTPPKKDF